MLERKSEGLRDRLVDGDGNSVTCFDLSEIDLHPKLAKVFLRAHAAQFGHTSIETQKQAFRCIRKLVLFLQDAKANYDIPLAVTVGRDFHNWIAKTGLKSSTAQSHQGIVMAILRWCQRNAGGVIAKDAELIVPSFSREEPPARRVLASDVVKQVLGSCYKEIEEIESRIAHGRSLLTGSFNKNDVDYLVSTTIRDLLVVGKGKMPSQKLVGRSGQALARRVAKCGGFGHLRSLISVVTADILPFYLAVVVQTGGNPMAIREMGINCIRPHPLRDDLEFLDWDKPRAKREQRVDFPKGKQWSAPNIVRRLLNLNGDLRLSCRSIDASCVFLSNGLRTGAPSVPSVQSLHNYLAEFLARNNLPDFDFKDWRPTVGREHRRAGGSIEAAKRRLNHANTETTALYVNTGNFEPEHYKSIAEFQGQLVKGLSAKTRLSKKNEYRNNAVGGKSATVFGFNCQDPFAGLDGITDPGSRCLNFTRCSTCAGSLVPVDDPDVIARILAAKFSLEEARERSLLGGWSLRFNVLYAGTLQIIDNDILPSVSAAVLEKAREVVRNHHIPKLE